MIRRATDPTGPYLLFMLALSCFALVLLGASALLPVTSAAHQVLGIADHAVCGLFLIDFLVSLARAPDRWRYFWRWGWLDLISSIPSVDYLRMGRAGRIVRILRVLRGVRSTRILAEFLLKRRAEGVFLAASLVSILLIVISAIGILQFETAPNSNIKTAEDALWWAVTTITTVGYGDRFPVTTEGRLLASALMATGVGLFGTFSGFIAAWFLRPVEERETVEIESLRDEVRRLRAELERSEPH